MNGSTLKADVTVPIPWLLLPRKTAKMLIVWSCVNLQMPESIIEEMSVLNPDVLVNFDSKNWFQAFVMRSKVSFLGGQGKLWASIPGVGKHFCEGPNSKYFGDFFSL